MALETTHHYRSSSGIRSPIDDETYDLLQALTSKCESIEAYAKYESDASDRNRQLFQELARADAEAAEKLLMALRNQIGGG